jgi:hypothetical protein
MTVAHHRKYVPPAPIEAPPDLAALVAAHLACPPGRESVRTLLCIHSWGIKQKSRLYQTYIVGDMTITLSDSLPKISARPEGYDVKRER